MALSGQSSVADSFSAFAPAGSSEMDAAAKSPVSAMQEAVNLALGSGGDAQATGASDRSEPSGTSVAFPGSAVRNTGAAPVLDFPPLPAPVPPRAVLHALQEWEGYVVELGSGEFVARLVDLTAGSSHEEEEAIFPLEEVSESDSVTMAVGSIFRWVIGYERLPAGTKRRVSQIVFRDLPRITERDFREGREWARETLRALKL